MKKYIYGLFFVLAMCCMSSCGSDSEIVSTNTEHETNYRFVVNVTKGNEDGTRATDKTGWVKGDIIYLVADKDTDKYFTLTYQDDDYWHVEEKTSQLFSKVNGNLHACYGLERREREKDWMIVYPEQLLYTDEGTYTKADDVIHINLDMNKHPYAKMTVKGIDKGYGIVNMRTQQTLTNLWNMTFADTLKNAVATNYDEQTRTATYYGIVSPTDNKTQVLLYNSEGIGYSRTYDKVMAGGEAIVLNGPNSSESSSWTKRTLVKNIILNRTVLDLSVDECCDLVATIDPVNAENGELEWYTSNARVATVDENGHVDINGAGDIMITAQTKDGTRGASCRISARQHVNLYYDRLVYAQGTGQVEVYVRNSYYNYYNYDDCKPIDIKQFFLENANTGKIYAEYNITDAKIDNNRCSDSYILNFSNVPVGTYFLGVNYICNNKENTVRRRIEIK